MWTTYDGQKIQLRDTFTVTMTYSHPFTIFTPSFAPPVQIHDSYEGKYYRHVGKILEALRLRAPERRKAVDRFKRILQNRKGDAFVFILILVFFILTLSAILIEYFRMESLYQQVEYVLQRGVNASVEYAMLDEYRRDGYARMDSDLAEETLYKYLHESMRLDTGLNKYAGEEWVYELEIKALMLPKTRPG